MFAPFKFGVNKHADALQVQFHSSDSNVHWQKFLPELALKQLLSEAAQSSTGISTGALIHSEELNSSEIMFMNILMMHFVWGGIWTTKPEDHINPFHYRPMAFNPVKPDIWNNSQNCFFYITVYKTLRQNILKKCNCMCFFIIWYIKHLWLVWYSKNIE